jgi:hypothetical protein
MPVSKNQFDELERAPSITEEIAMVLKENDDKAYSFEEIHRFIFGNNQRVVDMIFARVALMILNERRDIEVKRMQHMPNTNELYFAWKSKKL